MKIAYVIERYDPARGGAENYLHQLASFCLKQGHAVHLLAESFAAAPAGAILHPVPVLPKPASLRLLAFNRGCTKLLKQHSFEVVHNLSAAAGMDVYRPPGGVYRVAVERALKAHACGYALAKLGRMLSPKHWTRLMLEARQFRQAHCFYIANSRMVKQHMLGIYGIPGERAVVIYNGVDTERFHPRLRGKHRGWVREKFGLEDELVLLFVAHNFRLKGLRYLLEALAKVVSRGKRSVKLVVVGRGRAPAYRKIACRLGLEREVIFAGEVAPLEVFYAPSDILVHPTFYDPFSNVTLEALAFGIPVITTRYNGASEIMTEGKQGYIVEEPSDTERLAECILLLADDERRKSFGAAARELAEEFPLERNFYQTLEIYQKVVARKARTS